LILFAGLSRKSYVRTGFPEADGADMAVRIETQAEPIPGYRLLERIGGGGFGEVWKCEAPGGLHKAIKFVFGDLGAAGDDGHRAEQELKALSRVKTVRHPYILSLERYDIIDGQLLIVMELADRNLWDRYKECRSQGLPGIPREELLRYLEESAEALDLMNGQYGLQHLDIKPQNLFLVHQHVKVADFGLVKDLQGMQASVTGGITPVYASPETFDGYVSRFSDQYSLAIVYQELLCGQRPFNGATIRQLILQHLQAPPNLEALPESDRPAIARALAKSPDERHPSCGALMQALRAAGLERQGDKERGRQGEAASSPSPCLPVSLSPCHLQGRGPLHVGLLDTGEDSDPCSTVVNAPRRPSPEKQGDRETGRQGEKEPPSSPCPPVSLSPCLASSATADLRSGGSDLRSTAGEGRRAPPEVHGDGVLFPALVLGLGQMGLHVLQQTREALAATLGSLAPLPNLRFLLLDTDQEVVRQIGVGRGALGVGREEPNASGPMPNASRPAPNDGGLTLGEVLVAPLYRPSHYLKPRDDKPRLESWFNPRMLYRIPRSKVTTGVRALGRLAWCDNYRAIVRRLRTEVDALFDPQALAAAARTTGLGQRTTRPRVYVVTSLAGGTGGGMFLDVAYTVRALLRQAGCKEPDVVALLLLPAVDRNRTRALALSNACAALTELAHFARPDTCFRSKYVEGEPAVEDPGPPFGRCVVLPLPEETDETALQEVVGMAGQYLSRDLCSPLGRATDLARADLSGPPWEARGLFAQTFGLFRLSWPRRALLAAAGRRLCLQLVTRWMSKDSKPIRETVQAWVQEQWARQNLGAEAFLARLVQACEQKLGHNPERALQAILQGSVEGQGDRETRRQGDEGGSVSPCLPVSVSPCLSTDDVLGRLQELLGDPSDDGAGESGAQLVQLLREASDELVQEWGQKLAEMPVQLIEQPESRLAGAEEAVRQLGATIEQALHHHEPLLKELTAKASEALARVKALTVKTGRPNRGKREAATTADVGELLRGYARCRWQGMVLNQMMSAFVTLRGHLADEMREINACRVRLAELQRLLTEQADPDPARTRDGGRCIFPAGCQGLEDAVKGFLAGIGPEALHELDERIEAMLRKRFLALVNVCLSRANVLKDVQAALLETAEEFIAGLVSTGNVAEMFFEQHPDPEEAEGELAGFFSEAAPESLGPKKPLARAAEVCVLAAPPGAAGDRLRELARKAVQAPLHSAPPGLNANDEIVLYREVANLPLTDLEQLGPVGHDAYAQMSNADHFTPHSRTDVDFGEGVRGS
jgi:serine/threonine protein kinase